MFNFGKKRNTHKIFMDYASTTSVRKEVFDVMKPFFGERFFNPSSIYMDAVKVRSLINDARSKIAKILNVRSSDLYFTGSGTESDNLALLGVFEAYRQDKDFSSAPPHIITTKIEHPAVLEVCKEIENRGGEVSYVDVDESGIVRYEDIISEIKDNTVLISVMYANNEIGVVEPISKISREINRWKRQNKRSEKGFPFLHTDASQAPLFLDCNCERLGVDLMTLDGSKIYGPKGIGLLYRKHFVPVKPIMFGGGQENGLRPSTENVPAILGFTKAFELATLEREDFSKKMLELNRYCLQKIKDNFPDIELNGDLEKRLPNNVNICIKDSNAEFLVIKLDELGILCASATACKNLDDESSSYVLNALGKSDCASSSLRFTFGRDTNKKDIDRLIEALQKVI